MIDPKALLADLKGQVKALEADLRLYGVTDETTAAELERRMAGGTGRSADRGHLRDVARRPGDPGRRGLGPRHGLRPLLRGQRPDRVSGICRSR